jgi:hypothetical protein
VEVHVAQDPKQDVPPTPIVDRPPAEWVDAWLKLTGVRTTWRERDQLVLQFANAMKYAVEKDRAERERTVTTISSGPAA